MATLQKSNVSCLLLLLLLHPHLWGDAVHGQEHRLRQTVDQLLGKFATSTNCLNIYCVHDTGLVRLLVTRGYILQSKSTVILQHSFNVAKSKYLCGLHLACRCNNCLQVFPEGAHLPAFLHEYSNILHVKLPTETATWCLSDGACQGQLMSDCIASWQQSGCCNPLPILALKDLVDAACCLQ